MNKLQFLLVLCVGSALYNIQSSDFASDPRVISGKNRKTGQDTAPEQERLVVCQDVNGLEKRVVTLHTNKGGLVISRTNSVLELQSGMHYRKDGEWLLSHDQIQLTADGAAALEGRHKVRFS